ncbi:hypothetical protein [Methylobacterium indicum]|uniref:hypothetical protein n=1 Tax=Methylobacterium indicum TaxID=1775910 RepID=UPI000F7B7FF1|nr:hypothetical protein [Methylobacterium indicum]
MDYVESALPPLTFVDVENILRICRQKRRKASFIHGGSKEAMRTMKDILYGEPTIGHRIINAIEELEAEKQVRLLQLMIFGRSADISLHSAELEAKSIDPSSIARYMSEKRLFQYITRGMQRIDRIM